MANGIYLDITSSNAKAILTVEDIWSSGIAHYTSLREVCASFQLDRQGSRILRLPKPAPKAA